MTAHYAAPHRGGSAPVHENAALLIDFDNVTMGIRSDLTKELKNLLDSDIIRGKVAVQRAYADWRRYPQYIVPLSEGSVDLIFAPAYGSSKKNATDIRLAIDALELVFTRPEIGTFILLSGDSDFSSLVLKLKEYGKYVIGVGIKESSSDLLVQNCHEYYSYNALTGLQRAGEETPSSRMDPWELVQAAVERMAENDDVMRSDRLKQVMIELDESFDEKAIGYSKYNRFLSDAATRGRIKLRKLENGQFEVAPVEGRRKSASSAGAGRGTAPAPSLGAVAAAGTPAGAPTLSLDAAYDLLRRAVRDLAAAGGGSARDADVKRRMLELRPDWDEAAVGFDRFSHFLRQAHNSEVIDLQRAGDGVYEVVLPGGAAGAASAADEDVADDQIATGAVARPEGGRTARMERGARSERSDRPERGGNGRRGRRGGRDRDREREGGEEREERAPRSRGGRGRGRDRDRDAETLPPSEPRLSGDEATGVAPASDEKAPPARTPSERAMEPASEERLPAPEASSTPVATQATTPAATKTAADVPAGLGRGRRGPRGRGASAAPPPLLPGQAIDLGGTATPAVPATPAPQRSPEVHDVAPIADQVESVESDAKRARDIGPIPRLDRVLDPKQLGLPTEAGAVTRYLTNRYRGVGDKTAEQLVETFGAEHVFAALQAAPDRVTELLGAHRAGALLDAWRNDFARRSGNGDDMPPPVSSTRSARRSAYEEDDYAVTESAAPMAAETSTAAEPEPLAEAAAADPSSYEPETEAAQPAAEPSPAFGDVEREAEPSAAFGGVERELPAGGDDATERETPSASEERELPASDVERPSTPDLWSNAREPRGE